MSTAKFHTGDRVAIFTAEIMADAPAVVVAFKEHHRRWGEIYEVVDCYGDRKDINERLLRPPITEATYAPGKVSTQETYERLARLVADLGR